MNETKRASGEAKLAAWAGLLAVSELPEIVATWLGRPPAAGIGLGKLVVVALLLVATAWRERLRPLAPFAATMLVFLLALRASSWLAAEPWWRELLAGTGGSFTLSYLGLYARDVAVALLVLGTLWLVRGRSREAIFLRRGDLGAAVEPVRWLGIRAGERWERFVWIFGGVAAVAVVAVMLPTLQPTPDELSRAAPLAPSALLLAAINAFDEEVYFRLALLATLPMAVGRGHAQAMNVVLFGLAHYLAGSPSGIPGFLMTGFLAWVMGKCMLETRGLLGPWLIHWLPDVVIFLAYAVLWFRG